MNTTTGSALPPRSAPAGPVEPRQALVTATTELRGLVQQAHAAGLAIPFAAEAERLREPLVSSPLVIWVRTETAEGIASLSAELGLDGQPVPALLAVGQKMHARDVLRDAFEWREARNARPTLWYCTLGPVPADIEAWLAHDASIVLHESEAPAACAAASTRRLPFQEGAIPPVVLQDARHPTRELFLARTRLWQAVLFENALEQLASEHQRRLKSRKVRDDVRARELDRDSLSDPSKLAGDAYRMRLEDELSGLQRGVLESGKVAFASDGTLMATLRSAIDALAEADLIATPGPDVDRLRLNDRNHAHLVDLLKQHLRAALKQDWASLQAGRARLEDGLRQQLGGNAAVEAGTEQEWLQGFPPILLDNSYSGEVPRTGFWRSLSRGRQVVMATMGILGLLSLVFRVNWRTQYWIVLLLIPVFGYAAYHAAKKSKEERAHRVQKELEKLRDLLLREVRRVVSELQRERQARVQLSMDQLKRSAYVQLDLQSRTASHSRMEHLQRARGELRDRSRTTENKLRDAGALLANVSRARLGAGQALADADRSLRSALEPAPAPASPA